MASPTFDETYNDLMAVCKAAQKGLYDCGRLRGRNDLTSRMKISGGSFCPQAKPFLNGSHACNWKMTRLRRWTANIATY
jgi:hypothetical protein